MKELCYFRELRGPRQLIIQSVHIGLRLLNDALIDAEKRC